MGWVKILCTAVAWLWVKLVCAKEKKRLQEKIESIEQDKKMKEAIQKGDLKEVQRIIDYYRKY